MNILDAQRINQMYKFQMEMYQRILEEGRERVAKVGKAYEEKPIDIDPSLGQIHYKEYLNYLREKTCFGLHDVWTYLLLYLHDKRYYVGVDVGDGESFNGYVETIGGKTVETGKTAMGYDLETKGFFGEDKLKKS